MELTEIVTTKQTSEETLKTVFDITLKLGKIPIISQDQRAFFITKVIYKYIEEGILSLLEGIPPKVIENASIASGMPMGPLKLIDKIGLDIFFKTDQEAKDCNDFTFYNEQVFDFIKKYIDNNNNHGKKNDNLLSPKLDVFLVNQGIKRTELYSVLNLKRRFLTIQTIEAIKARENCIIKSPIDTDIGSILGWNFPKYTGGVLSYIELRGSKKFLSDCLQFEQVLGARFTPPPSLRDLISRKLNSYYEMDEFIEN